MVDSHHGMNDVTPLAYSAVWTHLRGGEKLSAVKDGAHLFSFQLRTNGTVKALIGAAYLAVGCLKPNGQRLEAPPVKWRQAPLDAVERRDVCRLFDNELLQGRLPTAFILVVRDHIDAANERAYAEAEPDLYRFIIDRGFVSFLPSIRNSGSLSGGQEKILRKWRAKDARKQIHVVPPATEPMSKAAQDRARAQAQMEADMERNRLKREAEESGERDEIPEGDDF